MESDVKAVNLELKYCERCGGLWIRQAGCKDIYCSGCADAMAQRSPSSRFKTRARMPGSERPVAIVAGSASARDEAESSEFELDACDPEWASIYGKGGHA
jgi:hypothetical protein